LSLRGWLEHPLTRGLDLDDPRTTLLRREVLAGKPFLRRVYEEWYAALAGALPPGPGSVLELGSGAGFLARFIPGLVRSEVFWTPGVDVVLDGTSLPFAAASLRGIVMTNVLHHIPRPRRFFEEAARCVVPGGVIAMVEPWATPWSTWVYTRFHHEPFDPGAPEWEGPGGGPLTGANGALPWILFQRDRERFARELPAWRLRAVEPMMPFRYLASGGISLRSLSPGWTYPLWRKVEGGFRRRMAMFALVVVERRPE
jgi:SAM-dependent methyltransferase